MLNKSILADKSKISHKQSIEKAEKELEVYRAREMKQLKSDFNRTGKQLSIS
ncbi:MAG: hypothetical protein LBS61_01960 [Endomicrobium sp.]|jgi:hypothetical protein|nr:hypothetical protein [Endomicrobium sp.]